MIHPGKFYERFWRDMGERFGKRWFDLCGPLPTREWKELLDEFTREEIDAALLRLKDRPKPYVGNPPTYTEFQSMLATAAKNRPAKTADPNQVRIRWRSIVTAECMKCAGLLNIVPYGELRLEQLQGDLYRLATAKCTDVVDQCCQKQQAGVLTKDIEGYVNQQLWNFLTPWRRVGEHYVGHLGAGVPRKSESDEAAA